MKEPSLSDFDINDIPIITVGATANMDESAFFDLMDKEVKPALEHIQGIARINLIGGQEREIQVNVNAERMSAYTSMTSTSASTASTGGISLMWKISPS